MSPTAHAIGAGRNIVGQTFKHLLAVGMLERSPGHGHPLRPEFRLSAQGKATAHWARSFLAQLSDDEWDTARRAWTLPVLRLVDEPLTFSHLRSELPPITDRGLSLCLSRMVKAEFIERSPSTSSYKGSYVAVGRGIKFTCALRPTFRL